LLLVDSVTAFFVIIIDMMFQLDELRFSYTTLVHVQIRVRKKFSNGVQLNFYP
jgi:hypothetical protein